MSNQQNQSTSIDLKQKLINENTSISLSNKDKDKDNDNEIEDEIQSKWSFNNVDGYLRSSILSKTFFWWAFRLIKLANLIKLRIEHVGFPEGKNKSENYLKDFKYYWEEKKYKDRKSKALCCTVIKSNQFQLIVMIILSLFNVGIEVFSVLLFRIFIGMFNKDIQETNYQTYQVAIVFFLTKIFIEITKRLSSQFQNMVGIKSTFELNCFIYEKTLKTSSASRTEKLDEGQIVNLLQVDSNKLYLAILNSPALVSSPIQLIVYIYLIFNYFSFSASFGLTVLVIFLIINYFMYRQYQLYFRENSKLRDKRMNISSETFNHLKLLKLYSWEQEYFKRILDSRKEELLQYKKVFRLTVFNIGSSFLSPALVSFATFAGYQYFETMKVEDIMAGLYVFSIIASAIRTLPLSFNSLVETMISMERVEKYLKQEEVDESNVKKEVNPLNNVSIKVSNLSFSWGSQKNDETKEEKNGKKGKILKESKKTKTEESESIITSKILIEDTKTNDDIDYPIDNEIPTVLKNIDISIKKGEFIGVIGEVGSGKTSLLEAIMNNMIILNNTSEKECFKRTDKIYINGTLCYVPQIPWIQNNTLKNNILFYKDYNKDLYNKTLELCELTSDIDSLIGGDQTEIGEKGINLSGGQKARVSLARAIYSQADIILLDDPISALDAHVGHNIMTNLIMKELKGSTIVLVTHALQYLSNCDRIMYMRKGRIEWEGKYEDLLQQQFFIEFSNKEKKKSFEGKEEIKEEDKIEDIETEEEKKNEKNNKKEGKTNEEEEKKILRITKNEDKEEGNVSLKVYNRYILYMGGYFLFLFFVFLVMSLWQGLKCLSDIWILYWESNFKKETQWQNLAIYGGLGISSSIFAFVRVYIITKRTLILSNTLHYDMIKNLINAPINLYHDTIQKGIILNRLTKDLYNLDVFSIFTIGSLIFGLFSFLGIIAICSIYSIYSLIFLPILIIPGFYITKYYNNLSRELTRLDSIKRSPLINSLAETVKGAVLVRAFNYNSFFMSEFHKKIDICYQLGIFRTGTSNWFGLVMGLFSLIFLGFLLVYSTMLRDSFDQGKISIMLTYTMNLQQFLFELLTNMSATENFMISMERCLNFVDNVPQEKPLELDSDKELPDLWPVKGTIKFVNYTTKYRPETEIVLKGLNFEVNQGERIGVVGRTGSGKSTLCLCLFRILEPVEGTIFIDNIDITNVGLSKLRKGLTIIPQDPSLMKGTLRYNIDPLSIFSEEDIKDTINKVGLSYLIDSNDKGLEQEITESGTNLSVGEKQLICICRALLRKSKIIIMDEATANIDVKTEETIQKAINTLLVGSTVITIAHRIKTIINYDRILVLANGELQEYDSPKNLIEKEGLFSDLVKKSKITIN